MFDDLRDRAIFVIHRRSLVGCGNLPQLFLERLEERRLLSAVESHSIAFDFQSEGSAFQADGKLVVVGSTDPALGPELSVVARYLSDGTLDPTFGNGGEIREAVGNAPS